ncbi:Catabolite repression HPr, partial [Dysosmobacter welbionis]
PRCRRTVWCPCGASGPGGPDTPTPCLPCRSAAAPRRCRRRAAAVPPDGRAAPGSCSKSGSRRGSGSPAGRRNGGVPWRRSPDPGSS